MCGFNEFEHDTSTNLNSEFESHPAGVEISKRHVDILFRDLCRGIITATAAPRQSVLNALCGQHTVLHHQPTGETGWSLTIPVDCRNIHSQVKRSEFEVVLHQLAFDLPAPLHRLKKTTKQQFRSPPIRPEGRARLRSRKQWGNHKANRSWQKETMANSEIRSGCNLHTD